MDFKEKAYQMTESNRDSIDIMSILFQDLNLDLQMITLQKYVQVSVKFFTTATIKYNWWHS